VLRNSVESLKHVEESLRREVAGLLNALSLVCLSYQAHRAETDLRSLEKVVGGDVWKFLEEVEILVNPELLEYLAELGAPQPYPGTQEVQGVSEG